ncbi:MAG: tetratricopeptide repeat protein [bacterium]|nr:tetratricopeptide repeat protein [bacterium]
MRKPPVLFLLLLISSALGAQTETAEIEARLADATGEARLELLAELTVALGKEDSAKTVTFGSEALELLRSFPEANREIAISNALSRAHIDLSDYPSAVECAARAEELARAAGKKPGLAEALRNLGRAYSYLGELERALAATTESIALYEELGDTSGLGNALNQAGVATRRLGNYSEALEYSIRAHQAYEEAGYVWGSAVALNSIGVVLRELGEYARSLEYFERAIELAESLGDEKTIRHMLGNIGSVHRNMGEPALALEYQLRALELSEKLNDQDSISIALINIGNAYQDLGQLERAIDFYRRSLQITEKLGEKKKVGFTLNQLAGVQRQLGDQSAALDTMAKALAIAEEIGAKDDIWLAYQSLSEIYAEMGRYRRALAAFQRYEAVRSEVFNEQNSRAVAEMEARFEAEQKEQEIELLKQRQAIDALEIEQQRTTRRALVTGLVLLGFLCLLLYNRYRLKVGTSRVIEQKNVELEHKNQEILRAESQLVQSEKMAALGQLVAGIAHEINNPVNFISTGLPLLRRVFDKMADRVQPGARDRTFDKLRERYAEILGAVAEGAHRTEEVVRSLRTFSRLDQAELKTVDLHESLDATLSLLAHRTRERIRVVRSYGEIPAVECYAGELNQALMSVLTNAVEAIVGEGTITVTTAPAPEDRVRITIRDSGGGMSDEVRQKMFDPFFTTKPVGQGKGLGLSISHGIVERHGGTIEVTSAPGRGTDFTVILPVRAVREQP